MKRLPIFMIWVLVVAVLYGGYLGVSRWLGLSGLELAQEYTTDVFARRVVKVAEGLGNITRIKLAPNESWMFATTLDGKVWGLRDENGKYVQQEQPVWQMETGYAQGSENGMTGLAVSYDFEFDKTIFVSMAKKAAGATGENQIWRVVLEEVGGNLAAKSADVIFRGNTAVASPHQIQGMTTVPIEGRQHILFAVGESHRPADARDLSLEAGKIMLIQIDGSNPMGARPYPRYPKIQAIGVRNVYDLSVYLPTAEVYFTDNGPEANDRLVIAPLFNANQFDFGWDGSPESMLRVSENGEHKPQYIVESWATPVAPVDIVADSLGRYVVNIFSTPRSAATEMLLGEKVGNEWETAQIVRPAGAGGNILGLALSFRSGTLFFGDFGQGNIYALARPWEGKRLVD